MPSWPSSPDSEEEAYERMELQALADELEFLNELNSRLGPPSEQRPVQPPHQAQVPNVQHTHEQSVVVPRQEVGSYQVPHVPIPYEQEGDSYQVCCYCGYPVEAVVRADGNDIGRRIQQCPSYPNGCNYIEWIDEPIGPRGITYANELEQEIRHLRNVIEQLRLNRDE